jgi:hypothetical protein
MAAMSADHSVAPMAAHLADLWVGDLVAQLEHPLAALSAETSVVSMVV